MRKARYLFVGLISYTGLTWAQSPAAENKFAAAEQLRKQKKYAAAAPLYAEAIRLFPNNYKYYFRKAQCEAAVVPPKLDDAIESALTSLELSPDFVNGYALLAQLYTRKKQFENAVSALNSAITHETDAEKIAHYRLLIGRLYLKDKKSLETIKYVERLLIAQPDNYKLLFLKGEAYELDGQWKQARESYRKATAAAQNKKGFSEDDAGEYTYKLAYTSYLLGDNVGYAQYLETLTKKYPTWRQKLDAALTRLKSG